MAKRNSASVAAQLTAQGFTLPFNIDPFIKRALQQGVADPATLAYAMILRSNVFKRFYPGIFRANGTLKMSPAEYESYVDSAKAQARSAGFTISRKQVGFLIQRDTSAEAYGFRVAKAAEIRANADVLNAFNRELKAAGEKPLRRAEQVFDFLTGKADQRVYDLYERSAIRGAAESAGLDITRRRARQLAQGAAGTTDLETALDAFGRIATEREFALQELRSFGLSDRDLQAIEFGLAGGAELERKRDQALAQREAALRAQVGSPNLERGIEGRPILDDGE